MKVGMAHMELREKSWILEQHVQDISDFGKVRFMYGAKKTHYLAHCPLMNIKYDNNSAIYMVKHLWYIYQDIWSTTSIYFMRCEILCLERL